MNLPAPHSATTSMLYRMRRQTSVGGIGGYDGCEVVRGQPALFFDRTGAARPVLGGGRDIGPGGDHRQIHRTVQRLRLRGDGVGRSREPGYRALQRLHARQPPDRGQRRPPSRRQVGRPLRWWWPWRRWWLRPRRRWRLRPRAILRTTRGAVPVVPALFPFHWP